MGQLLGGRSRWNFQVPAGKLEDKEREEKAFAMIQREKSQPTILYLRWSGHRSFYRQEAGHVELGPSMAVK